MPKLTGFFANLQDLYRYTPDDINRWLKSRVDDFRLQNFIGNRVIYPQSIASTEEEAAWELAVVKEFATRNPSAFYNSLTRKMIIPESSKAVFQPISKLVNAVTEIVKPQTTTTVYMKTQGRLQEIGSIFRPDAPYPADNIKVSANEKDYTVKVGEMTHLDIFERKVKLQINLNYQIMLTGGEAGILLDLRQDAKAK